MKYSKDLYQISSRSEQDSSTDITVLPCEWSHMAIVRQPQSRSQLNLVNSNSNWLATGPLFHSFISMNAFCWLLKCIPNDYNTFLSLSGHRESAKKWRNNAPYGLPPSVEPFGFDHSIMHLNSLARIIKLDWASSQPILSIWRDYI